MYEEFFQDPEYLEGSFEEEEALDRKTAAYTLKAPEEAGEFAGMTPLQAASVFFDFDEREQKAELADFMHTFAGRKLDPATEAWCATFLNATLSATGKPGTGSAMARSFLDYGDDSRHDPRPNDIAVFSRGDPKGPYGHVGLIEAITERDGQKFIKLLAGNQSNRVGNAEYPLAAALGIRRAPGMSLQEQMADLQKPSINAPSPAPAAAGSIPADDYEAELPEPDFAAWEDVPLDIGTAGAPPGPEPLAPDILPFLEGGQPSGFSADAEAKQESGLLAQMQSLLKGPTQPLRRMVRNTANMATQLPWLAGAVVNAPAHFATASRREAAGDTTQTAMEWFMERVSKQNEFNSLLTGLDPEGKPEGVVDYLAGVAGDSFSPAKGLTLPLTGLIAGAHMAKDLFSPSEAKKRNPEEHGVWRPVGRPRKAKGVANDEAPQDGQIVKGHFDVSAPKELISAHVLDYEDEANPQRAGQFVLVPAEGIYGPRVNLPANLALDQFRITNKHLGVFNSREAANAYLAEVNSRVLQPIESIGGPVNVRKTELYTMGGMAVMTAGMIFGPKAYRWFKSGSVPNMTPRPVTAADRDLPTGVQDITTKGDYFRTQDDVSQGFLRGAARVLPADPMEKLRRVFTLQTRGAATSISQSAIDIGRAESINFSFKVNTPLARLAKMETPEANDYMQLHNTLDEIFRKQTRGSLAQQANPGPVSVRGRTEADVLKQINDMEAINPGLRQFRNGYRENLVEYRDFLLRGEYGTIPKHSIPGKLGMSELRQRWANTVPYKEGNSSAVSSLAHDMKTGMVDRMQNEAKGLAVDTINKEVPHLKLFRQVTPEQVAENPSWAPKLVNFDRRGKPEHYLTNPLWASTLKMDPTYMMNAASDLLLTTKNVFQAGTTGPGAPWFAFTSAIRNHAMAKFTAGEGVQFFPQIRGAPGLHAPNIPQTIGAIPAQLLPQMAKAIGSGLEHGSNGWIGKVFGQQGVNALGQRLTHMFNESLYARLQRVGSGHGSILEQQAGYVTKLDEAIDSVDGAAKIFLNGWKSTWGSLHDAPSFAYAWINEGKTPLIDLSARTRNLGGDPRIGGQFMAGKGKPIQFEDATQGVIGKNLEMLTKGYGALGELGRQSAPWFNITQQGTKRVVSAYLENPAAFTANLWLFVGMPAAASYFWNRSLGTDPNGVSYSDYQMNRRGVFPSIMSTYIGFLGRPVEEGGELPIPHEFALHSKAVQLMLDHASGSSLYSEADDFKRVAMDFAGVALEPAIPVPLAAWDAYQGQTSGHGLFTGDSYTRRMDPFSPTAGMPNNLERMARAFSAGAAEVIGAGATAMNHTPKADGTFEAIKHGAGTSFKRALSKAPIVNVLTRQHPPATGNTRISQELYENAKQIRELDDHYKNWGWGGKDQVIDPKKRSNAGEELATQRMGPRLSTEPTGIPPAETTNPLFKEFAEEIHNKFKRDDPAKGGMGFPSLWLRHKIATDKIKGVRDIDDGNQVAWQLWMANRPKVQLELRSHGIDPRHPNSVRNFYERIRHDTARELLFLIKAVEEEMSQKKGFRVRLKDLKPNIEGGDNASETNTDY